jgi:RimJ/RimL family protein N-acetyltransferase
MGRWSGNVNSGQIEVRRLVPADAASYRDIRLAALEGSPEAFGSTFEAESVQPFTWFEDRLARSEVFGAFRDSELLGVAGFFIQQGEKKAHKGMLWGMYVRPNARKSGVGRRLVQAVLDSAGRCVELIQLTVVAENEQARRLYASLGFSAYGIEKNALKHNGRYYDEVLMAKPLPM